MIPGKEKGSAKTSSKLGERRLNRDGLMGNGVNTKQSYFCWKPQAWLPYYPGLSRMC